ncbi:hypothetical protein GF380_01460 [Candidatus Uhrbacteria bacterium]|nr:hypothetical protein [Candidatus Uhrbacteria bacterium]MBD3283947.1 hypothetical protein [Candidatus Uhrbacteria bacterium]
MKIYLPLLVLTILLGSGCSASPFAESPGSFTVPMKTIELEEHPERQPLCIRFSVEDGFSNWVEAYAAGEEDAIRYALGVKLPEEANPELIANIKTTLTEDAYVHFFCVLDEANDVYAWAADLTADSDSCRAMMHTQVEGSVTSALMESQTATTTCDELCAPKYQTEEKLVWQCDVQPTDTETKWSELHMLRSNGEARAFGCVEDVSGITPGCVR